MNAEKTRIRECTRKVRYRTNDHAYLALVKLVRTTGAYKGRLHTYNCHFCYGFHVGRRKLGRWV